MPASSDRNTARVTTDTGGMVQESAAYTQPADRVLTSLDVDPDRGLSNPEIKARRRRYGPNLMRVRKRVSILTILIRQFQSAVVILLAVAAILSAAFGEWVQALAVLIVLLINGTIGFVTEIRAVRSMEALRKLGAQDSRVRRNGTTLVIPARALVPGDIVLLEGGDLVPADLRLVQASNLACDESTLTGEALPDDKDIEPVAVDTPLPDRKSMLYKGTAVARGSAVAVVVATGLATELGRITKLVDQADPDRSPLEDQLERLSRQLIWVTLLLAGVIAVAGIVTGEDIVLMVEAGVALAVAAIPEGLPIVATLALARGMLRMARQNALVENLSAVETLGATTVILTDKTGTLTENRMQVERLVLAEGEITLEGHAVEPVQGSPLMRALEIGMLCTGATLDADGDNATGDPTEVALLRAGHLAGLKTAELSQRMPEIAEIAFDSVSKRMATIHRDGDGYLVAVKGAPETVLPGCDRLLTGNGPVPLNDRSREDWSQACEQVASRGLRLIALAYKPTEKEDQPAFEGLILVGIAALHDPPRLDVRAAIDACHRAGISVVMVTGDHIGTAKSVAEAVGLSDASAPAMTGRDLFALSTPEDTETVRHTAVFARVSPEQKLDLIRLHQQAGEVVAMTGDGVNDAPALQQADIGVAMGLRGTQVAREAADIVLRDDAFATIIAAIRQGRVIFDNIRRFAAYLLSCNLSEVAIVGLAVLVGMPLPILPLQILFLNLVTDVFPAFALGLGEGDPDVLKRKPRDPTEAILARPQWRLILFHGTIITLAVLGALMIALYVLHLPEDEAITVSFLTLALAQLWHVFNMREQSASLWRNDILANPYVWGALGLCLIILAAAILIPPVAAVLEIVPLDREAWLVVAGMSVAPLAIGESVRFAFRK